MQKLFILGAVLLLAGCTQQTLDNREPLTVNYQCENAPPVSVTFFANEERAQLTQGENSFNLAQEVSASGFIYSNGRYTIRGKGDELTLEVGRMMPINCSAVPAL